MYDGGTQGTAHPGARTAGKAEAPISGILDIQCRTPRLVEFLADGVIRPLIDHGSPVMTVEAKRSRQVSLMRVLSMFGPLRITVGAPTKRSTFLIYLLLVVGCTVTAEFARRPPAQGRKTAARLPPAPPRGRPARPEPGTHRGLTAAGRARPEPGRGRRLVTRAQSNGPHCLRHTRRPRPHAPPRVTQDPAQAPPDRRLPHRHRPAPQLTGPALKSSVTGETFPGRLPAPASEVTSLLRPFTDE